MVNEEYVMEGRHDLVEMEQVFAHESNDRPMTVSKRQAIWLRQDRDRMIVPEGFTTNKRVWFNGTFGELQKLLKDNIDEISKVEIEDFVECMLEEQGIEFLGRLECNCPNCIDDDSDLESESLSE